MLKPKPVHLAVVALVVTNLTLLSQLWVTRQGNSAPSCVPAQPAGTQLYEESPVLVSYGYFEKDATQVGRCGCTEHRSPSPVPH